MRQLIGLVVVALCWFSLCTRECRSQEASEAALYVFGDSLVDNGNNNVLPIRQITLKANYRPYGIDYPGGVPTGRFTNGKNVPDFIAEFLRLPHPIAIRDNSKPISLKGYNYGSGGAGILLESSVFPLLLDLTEQVRLFRVTKETKLREAFKDEAELENHLANSIFLIWMGHNDYMLNYFGGNPKSSKKYNPKEFADLLNCRLSKKLKELHGMGARKIVVFEAAPVGCLPTSVDTSGRCNESVNSNVTLFNTKLADTLQTLASQLPNSYISIAKTYHLILHAFHNPAHYGFTKVTDTCCEVRIIGGINFSQCKIFGGTTCANRDEYLFWDVSHPTEAVYRILSEECITNSAVCYPYSIHDLARLSITPSSSLRALDDSFRVCHSLPSSPYIRHDR